MSESYVDKHRPQHYGDLQGNGTAITELKSWLRNWEPGDTPQLLAGPPGVGKTSTAEVLANKEGFDLYEVNASTARTGDDLERLAGVINSNASDGHRLVLVDEADSIHHSTLRGQGAKTLYAALDAPANPVIITVNDAYNTSDGITNRCEERTFKLSKRSRKAKLRDVAEAEGIDLADGELDRLADRPDLRSAINDLQLVAEGAPPSQDSRQWDLSEWDMVDQILLGPDHGKKDTGDITPPDVVLWLDENISKDYRGLELAWAYEALSRADHWLGVAQRQSEYRYWKYAGEMAETVNILRRTEPYRPDTGIWDKAFPEWFRHSEPTADGSTDEAALFQALKDGGERFTFAGGFHEFRQTVLPILRDLSMEDRYQLAFDHGIGTDGRTALNITESDYQAWMVESEPETGEYEGTQNSAEW